MKKSIVALGAGLLLLLSGVAVAQPQDDDPLRWLERLVEASQHLSFKGTFTYQAGERLETIRIFYRVDDGYVRGRLKVLDGSPREIIRTEYDVRCVMPEAKTVVLDTLRETSRFPGNLLQTASGLEENYHIKLGKLGRVAGLQARAIVLTPKDELRYGLTLWVDIDSGMLLRMRMTGEDEKVIERASFSEIHIGAEINDDMLETRYKDVDGWRIIDVKGRTIEKEKSGWTLKNPVPGFTMRTAALKLDRQGEVEATHLLFSDGLAAVSVFVERRDNTHVAQEKMATKLGGTTNIYRCVSGDYSLTAMGEVPMETVRRICTGMVRKTDG